MDYNPLRKRPGFAPYGRSKEALLLWNIPGAAFLLTPRKPTKRFLTLQGSPTGGPCFYSAWLQPRAWEPGWEKHQAGSGGKKKKPDAAMQTGAGAGLHHHGTRYWIFNPKDRRKKNQQLPPHLLDISGTQQFRKDWEGTQQKYPLKGVSIISPKGFLTRKQGVVWFFFLRQNIHRSPQKSFSCGSLVFPAVY